MGDAGVKKKLCRAKSAKLAKVASDFVGDTDDFEPFAAALEIPPEDSAKNLFKCKSSGCERCGFSLQLKIVKEIKTKKERT
jgi:hypothetical protein